MMLLRRASLVLILLATIVSLLTLPAYAATERPDSNSAPTPTNPISPSEAASNYRSDCKTSFLGIPTWYKYLKLNPDCSVVNDGLNGTAVLLIIMALVEILLVLGGLVAVGFIIFGAFKFVLSQGEPQKIAGARTTIINAVIGLAVALIGSQVVSFIARTLGS